MHENVVDGRKGQRPAIGRSAVRRKALLVWKPPYVPADVQVEKPVGVVVEKAGGGRPAVDRDSRGGGDILERPIPPITIQPVEAQIAYVDVCVSIVVDIADGDAHTVPGVAKTGLGGHVHKSPVSPLLVQTISGAVADVELRERSMAVNKVDVQIAVAVEVKQCDATPHDLRH